MPYPISWLKDFVEIEISIPELAHLLTMAGLEVEGIHFVGLPVPKQGTDSWTSGHVHRAESSVAGIEWDREKIVVGSILEVMPHPNADRLVLCKLYDGQQEHIVLTGAPNLFEYKGKGPLSNPLKVAYAKEGAQIYDGHAASQELMTLTRTKIRGVESYSMACSEKELGISDDHEGIIILDDDAPVGTPLADYMGDAILEISILPSFARCASMLGLAREIAAITNKPLRQPDYTVHTNGPTFEAKVKITNPELNQRFMLGLVRDVRIKSSPYWVQRRLKLAGMRPVNNIVDATNYTMLELGEPLHAFDYDVLAKRSKGKTVEIITRTAKSGEKLTTLDGMERSLDETTVLVCDTAGPLSIAGVMGGSISEVNETTRNVLLEAATWNFINIRATSRAQNLSTEASYRFSRGVHPAMAKRGLSLGLERIQQWSGGVAAQGVIDNYPRRTEDPVVEITRQDVRRWLGLDLSTDKIAKLLHRLEFEVEAKGETICATSPDHRLDIGEGITGKADLIEEIARIYGYDNIPETRMSDELPPQVGNLTLEKQEHLRDLLVNLGLQEVICYRFTTPQHESRHLTPGSPAKIDLYVHLANPISRDKVVMRQSVLASALEVAERNSRIRERLALFEIGPIFLVTKESELPNEFLRLAIVLAGPRSLPTWQAGDIKKMDFYDLKGIITSLMDNLHIPDVCFEKGESPTFHPGKCSCVRSQQQLLGTFGELHPNVHKNYDWPANFNSTPILAADLDLDAILSLIPLRYETTPVPDYPPVLEDLALVVDEALPAERIEDIIRQVGGEEVVDVCLFDVYQGEKIDPGKKSLAYSLTYQAYDRTLTNEDVAEIRARIIRKLEQELGAQLRG